MYRKKGRGWTKHIDFMLLDVLCMQIAFIFSYIWRFGLGNPYIDEDYRILAVAFLFIDFFVEIVSDAFKNVLKRGYLDEFIVTCKHVVFVEIITTFFLFTTQMGEIYSRMSYYIMIPIYILVSYLGRMVFKKIIKKRGFASSKESLFVIAPEKLLRETLQGLKENGFGYTQIVAAATDADLNGKTICEIPIVANHDGIVDYACEEWVDEVLIPPCAESEYPYEMADIFLEMGIAVHRGITKNKVMAGSFNQIEKIGDYTVITASLNYARTTQLLAKRGMDILGGLVGVLPAVWSKMIKTEILRDNLCSEDKITFGEDVACIYNSILKCKSFYGIDIPVYYYRQNSQSMTKAYDARRFERLEVLFAYLNKKLLRNNRQLKSQYDNYILFCVFYASLNEAKNNTSFKEMGKKFEDGLKRLDLENFVNETTIKIGIPWNVMLYLIKKKKYRMLMVLCRAIVKVKYSYKA